MDKEKEIISQANEITNSMSPLDLVQKRCFYLIVQQVRKDYIETENPKKEYKDMTIHMTPENLARARDAKHITQAFESLKTLRNANFTIDTDDYMLNVGIINYAKYYKEKKIYEVQVSKEILPYLVDLSRRYFTSYNLTVAISLRHVSTQRFYELCNQYKHKAGMKFFIEADQLRNMLMLDGKYQKDAHLRKFVFDVAQKELKELYDKGQCDLCFDYKPDEATKVGKKYTRYWIYIHTRKIIRGQTSPRLFVLPSKKTLEFNNWRERQKAAAREDRSLLHLFFLLCLQECSRRLRIVCLEIPPQGCIVKFLPCFVLQSFRPALGLAHRTYLPKHEAKHGHECRCTAYDYSFD